MELRQTIVVAGACISLALGSALWASGAQAQAPLIQQVSVGDGFRFVEIRNTSQESLSLQGYWLSTAPNYHLLPEGVEGVEDDALLIAFPEGATLPVGGAVLLLEGEPSAFHDRFGFYPSWTLGQAEGASVSLESVQGDGSGLLVEDGRLALFHWDGSSDLIQDSDLLYWEEGAFADKSGVSLEGPDEDEDSSVYADETAGSAAPGFGGQTAMVRTGDEGTEIAGGNGLDGVSEVSEDLSSTWVAAPADFASEYSTFGIIQVGVKGIDGSPVENARVTVDGSEEFAATNAQGYAALNLPREVYTIRVEAEGYEAQEGRVALSSLGKSISVDLEGVPRHTLTLVVFDQDGMSLSGAQVRLLGDESAEGMSDESGTAIFEEVQEGSYKVLLTLEGYRDLELARVNLREDAQVSAYMLSEDVQPSVKTLDSSCSVSVLPAGSSQVCWWALALGLVGLIRRRQRIHSRRS